MRDGVADTWNVVVIRSGHGHQGDLPEARREEYKPPSGLRHAVSGAKAYIGQAARLVGQQAVQLHGAMGVVDDLIVSHYFKRLTMIDLSLGDADFHLGRFSDLLRPAAVG